MPSEASATVWDSARARETANCKVVCRRAAWRSSAYKSTRSNAAAFMRFFTV